MLEMRLPMAMSIRHWAAKMYIPVEIALCKQPGYVVPLDVPPGSQFLVVGVDIALSIIGDGRQLAVVLQLVL
jgi:hypothetical protein